RFRKIPRCSRDPVQTAGTPDGADQGYADLCWQTAWNERAGSRDLRERSGTIRQAHRRPTIRPSGIESHLDADFLSQRRSAAGFDVLRGVGRADQAAAQEVAAAGLAVTPCLAPPPRR